MIFRAYTGEIATNCSVNITCHGTFEAKSKEEALALINLNKKYQFCKHWQFPFPEYDKYLDCMRTEKEYMRKGLFICEGEPLHNNVIWKDHDAVISFFDRKDQSKR